VFALAIACGDGQGTTGGESGSGASNGTGGGSATGGIGGSVPPGESFSVKWGPTQVPSGVEATQCVVKRIGNTGRLFVNEIHNVLGATSHHFIVYRVNDTVERPEPFSCQPFEDTFQDAPLIITQRSDDRLRLPQGVVYALEPNQMVRLELHYINISAAPQMAEATSTFTSIDESDVENEADIMFMGDTTFGEIDGLATFGPSFLKVPSSLNGVSYFAITGHEHQWGTDVHVETTAGPGMPATPVYDVDNFRWDEPETVTFDPPFKVPDGGGFNLTCSWNSDSPVRFGLGVDDEMCFFWAYYYPSKGPVVCANGLLPCN
jgi:hypothetical protein